MNDPPADPINEDELFGTADGSFPWRIARGRVLTVGTEERPWILGIINLTTDSFFEASRAPTARSALALAMAAAEEGADGLDLGAESTRPGAQSVPPEDQLARVVPAIREIRAAGGRLAEIPISVDTTSARVARAALEAGADIVNDVSAGLDDPSLLSVVAEHGAGLILMHRLAPPARDAYSDRYEQAPEYTDVVEDVRVFLESRMQAALAAGVAHESIVLDPGLGFGKTVEQNLTLISGARWIGTLGRPVMSALSRKSFVGRASLGRDSDPSERLFGTLAMSVTHGAFGASIYRVHDVRAHREALDSVWHVGEAYKRYCRR